MIYSGNIISTENEVPVLIDPMFILWHPEMDWAMLDHFWKFSKTSFDTAMNK